MYCIFWQLFQQPRLDWETVWREHLCYRNCLQKQMPKMLEDKKINRGECQFLYSKNVMACKCMENRSVLLESTVLERIDDVPLVQRTEKDLRQNLLFLACCSKAIQQWSAWGLLYGSTNCSISVRSQIICSFLYANFLWFVRYCLCQQFSRI